MGCLTNRVTHNNNVGNKKNLIIKDSFLVVVIPFLSLVVSDVSAVETWWLEERY